MDGEEVALVVMYLQDIIFCGCKKIGDDKVSALNVAFPVKNLGELSWFMGNHYERHRKEWYHHCFPNAFY